MGFIRLIVFGFVGLSVLYLMISVYSRSVRRERLEKEFDADHPDNVDEDARDAYVAEGIAAYNSSIRPKLIGLVYVVPTIAIAAIIYMINEN
ncbi:hypothetical protein CLV80_106109 [Yoonia maritima]|uniref:Cation/multidrug efflux pump n=1 Tax=Yoonia maritima TaxID=1435347 RepID=A0A2T0VYF8_9RHOB|nr:hypothetical protein [Yoonia maritima]PRY77265.1 hypothetical protein CLV80_106109 [Yoonia maritima]